MLCIIAEICTEEAKKLTPYVLGSPNEKSEILIQNIK